MNLLLVRNESKRFDIDPCLIRLMFYMEEYFSAPQLPQTLHCFVGAGYISCTSSDLQSGGSLTLYESGLF